MAKFTIIDSKGKTTHEIREGDTILAISARAILVRRDGEEVCLCPYMCLAANERCEFI